jgi:hypothetical protein
VGGGGEVVVVGGGETRKRWLAVQLLHYH